jgi:TonB family protein
MSPVGRRRIALLLVLPVLLLTLASGQQNHPQSGSKMGDDYTPPKAIFTPQPDYTAEAAQSGIEGKVSLKFRVLQDGTTRDVTVVKTLDPGLDQAAVDAVAHWKFHPATRAGVPVATELTGSIGFSHPPRALSAPGIFRGLPCTEKIDSREIKDLLRKAAKGDAKAQFTIGCAYEYGAGGLPKDRAQAGDWYLKAAEAGLVPAQHFLGENCLLRFDYVRAYTWLKIAELGGYKDGNDTLRLVTELLSADQLSQAESQAAEWKQQHGAK